MTGVTALARASERAGQQLATARDAFLAEHTPQLSDGQHEWIVGQARQDPQFFDALVQKFGTEQLQGYLERFAKEPSKDSQNAQLRFP